MCSHLQTNMSYSVKWCFLAILLSGVGSLAEQSIKSYRLCTPTDTPGMCLFKGLLKNALLYMTRKNVVTDKNDLGTADGSPLQQSKGIEEYLMEQIRNIFGLFSFGFDLPTEVTAPWSMLKSSFLSRGKKNKNLGPMLAAGLAVMAGTLMPILFGMLFMLAGKAIMTSLMAITISGLLGLKTLFSKHEGGGHVKAYSAPSPHYTEAQFEQELGIYKGQTEAKMHSTAANYYTGESNLSGYYKGEQQINGSNQPEYYVAASAGASPKFHGNHNENNKITVDKND